MNLGDFPSFCVVAASFIVACISPLMCLKPFGKSYLPNYDFYHNISRMNDCLRFIAAQYTEFLDVEMQYRSRLGLSQFVLHITNFSLDAPGSKSVDTRSRILLSYGEHAAEFFPVQSMFYLLENITKGFDFSPRTYEGNFTRFVLNHFDLYLLTVVNPDGRVVIERTKNYCWIGTFNNVDLNSDLQDSADDEKSTRIMAEPECRVIRDLVSQKQFDALISFHSGQRKIFFPLPDEKPRMSQLSDVQHLASIMSSSVVSQYSILPLKTTPTGGSIFAYAANERKVEFTYKISMWENKEKRATNPDEDCFSNLNPPSENLEDELEAVHPLYSTLFNYMHYWKASQLKAKGEQQVQLEGAQTSQVSFRTVLILVMACVCACFISQLRVPFSWRSYYRRQRRIVSLRSLGTLFTLFNIPIM